MKKPFESCTLFKRVLLVEDNPEIIAEIHDILDLHFFEVTAVSSGPAAIQELLKNNFDVIVCDFTMGNLPSDMFFQAVVRIRPHLSNCLVAINDASSSNKSRGQGGVSIWKPIEPQILVEAVQGVLKKAESMARDSRLCAVA